MFERILYITTYWLFAIMVWMAMTPAKADLTYKTYAGTGAYPTFPGNGGSLYYGTVLSTGTVTSLDYNWGSGLVLDSGRNERVIVNFYGYITIPDTGSQDIQFYLYADDGVYMKIDDTVVINDWNEQGPGMWNYVSTDQTLTGGSTYYIDAWWYENGGGAAFKLYWDQTGSVALVPSSAYSTTIPTPTSSATSTQTTLRTTTRGITSTGNQIYITQSGDNLDLDITQYDNDQLIAGTGSTANNLTNATITGDDNTVSITQGNSAGSFSDDNVVLFDLNGTNNSVTIRQGDNVDDAGGHRTLLNVTGNYNTTGINQHNDGGVGSDGHFMDIDIASNSNTINTLQQGTGEHFLDVTLGSDQTVDITQDGSGDHAATIDMSGYSTTLDLSQGGSTDKNYTLNTICTNSNGCGTTTVNQQ